MRFKKTKWTLALIISSLIFTGLMLWVKIPTGIAHTQINLGIGWLAVVTAAGGPILGMLVALFGHAVHDLCFIGNAWWSWVIADGLFGLLLGLATQRLKLGQGQLTWAKIWQFNLWQLVDNVIAWMVIAPLGDVLIYGSSSAIVFKQGWYAGISNFLVIATVGTCGLWLYQKIYQWRQVKDV